MCHFDRIPFVSVWISVRISVRIRGQYSRIAAKPNPQYASIWKLGPQHRPSYPGSPQDWRLKPGSASVRPRCSGFYVNDFKAIIRMPVKILRLYCKRANHRRAMSYRSCYTKISRLGDTPKKRRAGGRPIRWDRDSRGERWDALLPLGEGSEICGSVREAVGMTYPSGAACGVHVRDVVRAGRIF